jgi:hypothetical protein
MVLVSLEDDCDAGIIDHVVRKLGYLLVLKLDFGKSGPIDCV